MFLVYLLINNNVEERVMRINRATVLWRSCGVLFCCLFSITNQVYAQAVATSTLLWDTFKIESGNTDYTAQVTWEDQKTFVSYTLNDGIPVDQNFSGWDVSLSASDVGVSVSANSVTDSFSVTSSASINSDIEIQMNRSAVFTAPASGFYTFSIDYDLSAFTDNFNSDENTIDVLASPFAELMYTQEENGQFLFVPAGKFAFTDNQDIDPVNIEAHNAGNPTLQLNDTLVLTTLQPLSAGERIEISLEVQNLNLSTFSGTVITTPVPAALPLMVTGLIGLFGIAKRKS